METGSLEEFVFFNYFRPYQYRPFLLSIYTVSRVNLTLLLSG